MANKTQLSQTLTDEICQKLRAGVFPKAACESCGTSVRNYHYWRKRGEDEVVRRETHRPRKSEQPFVDFFTATTEANANAELHATLNIRRIASDKEVEARTRLEAERFFLTSRFRDNWGQRINHDVKAEVQYEVVISEPLKSSTEFFDEEEDEN